MKQVLFRMAFPGLIICLFAISASAQERFAALDLHLESRDGIVAVPSAGFLMSAEDGIIAQAHPRELLPQGRLENHGRAEAHVVVWIEPYDERRGFAIFNPRRTPELPASTVVLAHSPIPPALYVDFAELVLVSDQADLRQLGDATAGRLIIAVFSDDALDVRGTVQPSRAVRPPVNERGVTVVDGYRRNTPFISPDDAFTPGESYQFVGKRLKDALSSQ